jgi:sec-independent protein translocase protein TatA
MLSSVFLFLNIGTSEMVLILFAALMLFGGDKLPELARGLGKGIRDFKDASEDVKREINNQINNYEEKKTETTVKDTPLVEESTTEHTTAATAEDNEVKHPIHGIENTVPNTIPISDTYVSTHEEEPAAAETHIDLTKKTTADPVKTEHE